MKKIILPLVASLVLISCGGADETTTDAQSICDCFSKAKALPDTDPNRFKELNDCAKKQQELHAKYKDDAEKAGNFSKSLLECAK